MSSHRCPAEFLCALTGFIMTDPVMTSQGIHFERAAILTWLGAINAPAASEHGACNAKQGNQDNKASRWAGRLCPITLLPLLENDLRRDEGLRQQIEMWHRTQASTNNATSDDSLDSRHQQQRQRQQQQQTHQAMLLKPMAAGRSPSDTSSIVDSNQATAKLRQVQDRMSMIEQDSLEYLPPTNPNDRGHPGMLNMHTISLLESRGFLDGSSDYRISSLQTLHILDDVAAILDQPLILD